jgi:hypothetical protein
MATSVCPCCNKCCPTRTHPLPKRLWVNIVVDTGDIGCLGLGRTSWPIDYDAVRDMWWSNEPTGDCQSRFGDTGCTFIQVVVQCDTCHEGDPPGPPIPCLSSRFLQLSSDTPPEAPDECANEIQEVNNGNQLCPADPVFIESFISTHTTGVFGCCFQTPNLNFRVIVTE